MNFDFITNWWAKYNKPETAMTTKEIIKLQSLLAKMKPGPYEYWATDSNDLIAAECKDGKGNLIAALPGITSLPAEFAAITALLNAAPELIRLARLGLDSQNA